VWIGEIQWMLNNGYPIRRNPILQTLDHIENRDAILNEDGSEAEWPTVDVIIGNPPFLGGKKFVSELGEAYATNLQNVFSGRVPGLADLVCYWFEKATSHILAGKAVVAGFVSTNSIRDGFGREVISRVNKSTPIFNAWSDEEWINDGASVRVSIICFSSGNTETRILDGIPVCEIHNDLTSGYGLNLTLAKVLEPNLRLAFQGTTRSGPFDITGTLARSWLGLPNPNGKPNSDVIRPWSNGLDMLRRQSDTWIIDFGTDISQVDASLYEVPFEYCRNNVKPTRINNRNPRLVEKWWHYDGVRVRMRSAINPLPRYIATTITAKHRIFVWFHPSKMPDATLIAIARADDTTFGILHSRIHELWALKLGTSLEDRPRYTPSTTFETFPFPQGLTPNLAPEDYDNPASAEIAETAKTLNQLRENWLNPPEWVEWQRTPEEERAGYPARPIAKAGHEADLKKRTLTNLYNARPAWLDNIHKALDRAVANAYGWNDYTPEMSDDEILRRLLTLNLARSEG